MLDGHKSHIDLSSIDYCRENGILLYALPPNTTHILQPAEIPFRNLKREYDKAASKYNSENDGALVTKLTFARVLGEAWIATYTPRAITQAFKATGIHPLNPDAIDPIRLAPSLPTHNFDIERKSAETSDNSSDTRKTRSKEIEELRRKVKELELENERLKHPGTSSIATVLRYPIPRPEKPPTAEGSKKSKGIPFSQLLTSDDIRKELQDREDAARLESEQRAEKAAERERKREEKKELNQRKQEEKEKERQRKEEQQRKKEQEQAEKVNKPGRRRRGTQGEAS